MEIRPFISYAREDRDVAMLLHAELTAVGAEPWLDAINLLPGTDWEGAIEQAIASATHVIALVSARSVNKRGYVQKELRRALAILEEWPPGTVYVIPVRLDKSTPRHPMLQRLHWVDLFDDYGASLRQLIAALNIPQTDGDSIAPRATAYADVPSDILASIVSRAQRIGTELKTRGVYVQAEIEAWRFLSCFSDPSIDQETLQQILRNLASAYPESIAERQVMLPREVAGWKLLQTIGRQFRDTTEFEAALHNALTVWPNSFAGQYFYVLAALQNLEDGF